MLVYVCDGRWGRCEPAGAPSPSEGMGTRHTFHPPWYFHIDICIYTSYKIYLFICIFTYVGFPDNSVGKQSACNAGDPRWIPGLGRSPGEGIGYPLQYSGLENSMHCTVHGVTKSQM